MDPASMGYYQDPNYLTSAKVDPKNFVMGGDPNWVSNFAQQQQGTSNDAWQTEVGGQQLNNQAKGLATQATAAAGRGGPTANYATAGQTLADAQQRAQQGVDQTGQQQGQLAGQLQQFAQQAGSTPSAAQAQLKQGENDALQSQLALARSGSGFGESAGALDAAGRNSASTIAQSANASAQTAAQEAQATRAAQLQALGQAGTAISAQQQGELGQAAALSQIGQQQGEEQEFNTNAQLQGRAQNDALQESLSGQSLSGQSAALGAENASQNTDLATQQLTLGANQDQLQASEQQEALNAQLYGTDSQNYQADLQNQVANRNLSQQANRDLVSGIGSVVSSIGGLAMLSDARAKRRVRRADPDLDRVYRALTET